jgi:beta-galactosidase
MDGLVDGNGQPYSTLYEVSAVFAPFKVNPKDIEKGEFYITNLLDFTYLSRFECCFEVTRYGKIVFSGSMGILPISPGQCESITIPYQLPPNGICHVRIFFRLFGDTPYAKSGTEMGFFQFLLPVSTEDAKENISFPSPTWKENENEYILSAKGCRYVFSRLYGTLTEISLNNKNLLATPWKLQCFKAPTVSEKQVLQEWYEAGYHQLQSRCESTQLVCEGNTVKITALLILGSKGKEPIFTVQTTYVFYGDGTLTFACQLDSKEVLPPLPRLGVAFELPEQYNQFRYLGFGPHENDRYQNHSAYLGDFSYKIKPSTHSRLNENRQGYLCQLTNNKGVGLAVWQADEMGFSTLPSSCGNHHTILHLDAFASFYGSQEKTAIHHTFGFSLKPVTKEDNVLSDLLK